SFGVAGGAHRSTREGVGAARGPGRRRGARDRRAASRSRAVMDLTALASHLRRITVGLANGSGGVGSGVIWAPGLIVTNAHVVRARRIGVRGADGQRSDGVVVARDDDADLAVLRAPAVGFPAAMSSGDPYRPRVGSIVVAVGHPFGIPGALTMGVVH